MIIESTVTLAEPHEGSGGTYSPLFLKILVSLFVQISIEIVRVDWG